MALEPEPEPEPEPAVVVVTGGGGAFVVVVTGGAIVVVVPLKNVVVVVPFGAVVVVVPLGNVVVVVPFTVVVVVVPFANVVVVVPFFDVVVVDFGFVEVVVGAWRLMFVNFVASSVLYFLGTPTASDVVPPNASLFNSSLNDALYFALTPGPNCARVVPIAKFWDAPASMSTNTTNRVVAAVRAASCVARCAALRSPGTALFICM
jgi:hypothetical protein